MNVKLTISYDGTAYCGWQIQPNGNSIQQELEQAIYKLTNEKVTVTGSGRTDAGVHAEGQVANFIIDNCSIPAENFYKALNTLLPQDIRVLQSSLVDDGFNARKSAKKKTYRYSFYLSEVENPFLERYFVMLKNSPDISKMQECANLFVGERDFKCFTASGSGAKTTVRTIYDIKVEKKDGKIFITVTGNGFLYNMVRTMSGTILEAGQGLKDINVVNKMLVSCDRKLCGRTLPAKGLTLLGVEY